MRPVRRAGRERDFFRSLANNKLVPKPVDLVHRHLRDDFHLQSLLAHCFLLMMMILVYLLKARRMLKVSRIHSEVQQLVREKKKSEISNQLAS
jgi:hypothetical protein